MTKKVDTQLDQMRHDQQHQYAKENQARPINWAASLPDLVAMDAWTVDIAANLLCALRADRPHYAPSPLNTQADNEDFFARELTINTWVLDDLERRRWHAFEALRRAIAGAALASIDDPARDELRDRYAMTGTRLPEGPEDRLVRPKDVLQWARETGLIVPEEFLALVNVTQRRNPNRARGHRDARDSTFAAALILIERFGLNKYQKDSTQQINAKTLWGDINTHREQLFDEEVKPLSIGVFREKLARMRKAFDAA